MATLYAIVTKFKAKHELEWNEAFKDYFCCIMENIQWKMRFDEQVEDIHKLTALPRSLSSPVPSVPPFLPSPPRMKLPGKGTCADRVR